jgi:hypothetical protein
LTNLAFAEDRREHREDVHHRTRGIDREGATVTMLVVNISSHGMMARCEAELGEGDWLRVTLPKAGTLLARVRWALGGRVGFQFDAPIPRARYYELLAMLAR